MNGGIYFGRLLGIPLRLHWSWFPAVLLIAWPLATDFFPEQVPQLREYTAGELAYWTLGLVGALGMFLCVLLHELGHAVVARRVGIPVRGIRLFIFGGVMEMTEEPRRPSHEIMMALGGPAVTFVLILLFGGLMFGLENSGSDSLWTGGAISLLTYLAAVNTALLCFNMIPAFPLDGGRVLRGLLWLALDDYSKGTRVAGAIGLVFSGLLIAGGVLMIFSGGQVQGGWFIFLGLFLNHATRMSLAYARMQHRLTQVAVGNRMQQQFLVLDGQLSLKEALEYYFKRFPDPAYPVIEEGRFVGMLTLDSLDGLDPWSWTNLRVGEVAASQVQPPTLHPDEPLLQALRKVQRSGYSPLPVVLNGQLVGLLFEQDLWADVTGARVEPRGIAAGTQVSV